MKKIFLFFLLFYFLFSSQKTHAATPVIIDPINDSSVADTSPRLSWEYLGDCIQPPSNCFLVEVAGSDTFSPREKFSYTNNTYYTPQNLALQKWFWRVKAKDQNQVWSDWAVSSFTIIEPTPSPTPTPASSPTEVASSTPTPTSTPTKTPTPKPTASLISTSTPRATTVAINLGKELASSESPKDILGTLSAEPSIEPKKQEVKTLGASENNLSKILIGLGVIIILSGAGIFLKSYIGRVQK